MRGTVRREARALARDEALRIIREAEYGVLASVDSEGCPSTAALNHTLFDDGCLYFHSGYEGEKMDNLRANPQVSFFVTGTAEVVFEQFTTTYTSAVIHGTICFIEDTEEKRNALKIIVERFSDGTVPQPVVEEFIETSLPNVAVLKLRPEYITGKARLSRKRVCLPQSFS